MALATILIAASAASPAAAQQQAPGVVRTPGGVQVDFQNTDMRLVVAALADAAGLNVVYGDLPQKTVTLRTTQPVAPTQLRVYLNSLLQANQLELKDEGAGLLRIVPNEAAAARAAQPQAQSPSYASLPEGAVRVFVHRLRHAPAEDMARSIGALFGIGDGAAGQDRAQSLSEQLRGQSLDANGQPRVPRAQPGMNASLQGQVQIFADARTNALLIRAAPADYETLRQAIEQLDTRPLQVMIEVVIAEVRRNSQFGLGIDVRVPTQTIGNEGSTTIGGELIGGTAGDVALRVLKLGNVQANVIIHALAASGEVTILSRPVILAQNNESARILVGDQRPFIQISRSLPTDNAVRDQVIQYRDVGTQLTIRPTVNPDGYVTLAILQEVSNATSETQFGAPIISTREAETRLLVKDGHTVVIGGLVDHQRNSSNSGIPILKNLPLIGGLFRSTSQQKTSTELFLFLVPHVLYSDEDMDSATQMVRERTDRLDHALPDSIPLFWKESQDTAGTPVRPRTQGQTPAVVVPQPAQSQAPQGSGPPPAPESDEVALVDIRRRDG